MFRKSLASREDSLLELEPGSAARKATKDETIYYSVERKKTNRKEEEVCIRLTRMEPRGKKAIGPHQRNRFDRGKSEQVNSRGGRETYTCRYAGEDKKRRTGLLKDIQGRGNRATDGRESGSYLSKKTEKKKKRPIVRRGYYENLGAS